MRHQCVRGALSSTRQKGEMQMLVLMLMLMLRLEDIILY